MITSLQQDVNVKIDYEGQVKHPRSSFLIYSLDFIAERFVYVLKPLISTTGGRLPRAWLEPPCASHSGVSRLISRPRKASVFQLR